jgi:hypothetical protein
MTRNKYWEMNTQELAAATKQFDEPLVADKSRLLTPAEREQWARVKRKRGRPRVGQGYQRISVSLERGLLARVTALVKKRRITRSKLFTQVLEAALAKESAGEGSSATPSAGSRCDEQVICFVTRWPLPGGRDVRRTA